MYCNGANTKAACCKFTDTHYKKGDVPVKRNGVLRTGYYPEYKLFLNVIDFDVRDSEKGLNITHLPSALQKTMLVLTGSRGIHAYYWIKGLENKDDWYHNYQQALPVPALLSEVKHIDTRTTGGKIFGPGTKFEGHPTTFKNITEW